MQSLDAINGVSKLMEGFAVTLDNVIGQAFVDWGTPSARGPRESPSSSRPCGPTPPPAHRQEPSNRKSTEDAGWGDFDVVSESESPKKEKPARRQLGLDNKSNVKPGEGGRVLRLWCVGHERLELEFRTLTFFALVSFRSTSRSCRAFPASCIVRLGKDRSDLKSSCPHCMQAAF